MTRFPYRSYLYVPGLDVRRMGKALASTADALVLDLEDSVPPGGRDDARAHVRAFLSDDPAKPTYVRVSADWEADLAAIAGPQLRGVRIPKCEDPDQVRRVCDELRAQDLDVAVEVLLESALGIESAFALATADASVERVVIGEADLRADLRVSSDEGLSYARLRAVSASRAAKLPGPCQSVYVDTRDVEGLRESTLRARAIGFWGRSALNPAQAEIINEAFTPTEAEVARARALIDGLEQSTADGRGALLDSEGRFVDEAVARSARWTLGVADRFLDR